MFESAGKCISCHVFSWNVVKYLTLGKAFLQRPERNILFFCSPSPLQIFMDSFSTFNFSHKFQYDVSLWLHGIVRADGFSGLMLQHMFFLKAGFANQPPVSKHGWRDPGAVPNKCKKFVDFNRWTRSGFKYL